MAVEKEQNNEKFSEILAGIDARFLDDVYYACGLFEIFCCY